MKEFFKSMMGKGGYSSKRFCGFMIVGMLCFAYMYCTIKQCQMLEATYGFMALAGTLLGIETIFTKGSSKNGK